MASPLQTLPDPEPAGYPEMVEPQQDMLQVRTEPEHAFYFIDRESNSSSSNVVIFFGNFFPRPPKNETLLYISLFCSFGNSLL